jgi:hypothetical protein
MDGNVSIIDCALLGSGNIGMDSPNNNGERKGYFGGIIGKRSSGTLTILMKELLLHVILRRKLSKLSRHSKLQLEKITTK